MNAEATSSDFGQLRGVRLGRRERALLLAAPGPGSFESEGTITGGMPVAGFNLGRNVERPEDLIVIEDSRSARVAALRAAKKLWELGLVEYRNQWLGERSVYICLTDLGAAVVERYRRELSMGARIRWGEGSTRRQEPKGKTRGTSSKPRRRAPVQPKSDTTPICRHRGCQRIATHIAAQTLDGNLGSGKWIAVKPPNPDAAKLCKRHAEAKAAADNRDGLEAEVLAQNAEMRAQAEAEIAAGNTCPVPRQTMAMSDEEWASYDEEFVRANSQSFTEQEFSRNFTPAIRAAYQRLKERGELEQGSQEG